MISYKWLSNSYRLHQIRFRPGLSLGPLWGSLQRSPDPVAGLREPTSKERVGKGMGKEGRVRRGRGRGDRERGNEREMVPGKREGRGWERRKEKRGREEKQEHSSVNSRLRPYVVSRVYRYMTNTQSNPPPRPLLIIQRIRSAFP